MRVLIADDDPTSRKMLELLLGKLGYEIVVEGNGQSALDLLLGPNPPEIAILDWMMPQLDGVDVCRRVRERSNAPYTYILMLTSKKTSQDIVKAFECGADDYILKPFNINELHARMKAGERILGLQRELLASREELRRHASSDALTGLLNRGSVMQRLEAEFAKSVAETTALSALMVDIDDFKRVNDSLGHPAGDSVLREAAQRLAHAVSERGHVGRYGGEEFLIVFPGFDANQAERFAQDLRAMISGHPVVLADGSKVSVTSSFGVAAKQAGESVSDLIGRADAALLKSKRSGKNTVTRALGVVTQAPPPAAMKRAVGSA